MSDNRKAFEEWWNEVNPEPNRTKRVQYTDAYTCFIAGYKSATEQSSKEIERLNALVAMQNEALKHAQKQPHPFGHLELFEKALSESSETVEAFMAAHAAKVLDIAMEQCDLVRNKYADDVDRPEREFALLAAATNDCKNAIAELRATKVKE